MSDCIFCRIVNGEIPSQKIYEDEYCLAFKDIAPKAPVHALVIPKKHIDSLVHLTHDDRELIGRLTLAISEIAEVLGLEKGFKTLINTGPEGGQEVYHLHYHLLAGKKMLF